MPPANKQAPRPWVKSEKLLTLSGEGKVRKSPNDSIWQKNQFKVSPTQFQNSNGI